MQTSTANRPVNLGPYTGNLPSSALIDCEITRLDLRLLLFFATVANAGQSSWWSLARIAEHLSSTESSVCKSRRKLVELGYLNHFEKSRITQCNWSRPRASRDAAHSATSASSSPSPSDHRDGDLRHNETLTAQLNDDSSPTSALVRQDKQTMSGQTKGRLGKVASDLVSKLVKIWPVAIGARQIAVAAVLRLLRAGQSPETIAAKSGHYIRITGEFRRFRVRLDYWLSKTIDRWRCISTRSTRAELAALAMVGAGQSPSAERSAELVELRAVDELAERRRLDAIRAAELVAERRRASELAERRRARQPGGADFDAIQAMHDRFNNQRPQVST